MNKAKKSNKDTNILSARSIGGAAIPEEEEQEDAYHSGCSSE